MNWSGTNRGVCRTAVLCWGLAAALLAGCGAGSANLRETCGQPGRILNVDSSAPTRPDWMTAAPDRTGNLSWWTGRRTNGPALDGALTDARLDAFRQVVEHMGLDISVAYTDSRKDDTHEVRDLLTAVAGAEGSGWKEREGYWETFERCEADGSVSYVHDAWVLVSVDEAKVKTFIDRDRKRLRISAALNRTSFVAGEQVELTISTNRSAYIYLVAENACGETTLIFPNPYSTNNLVEAGHPLQIPDKSMGDAGVSLAATLPAGDRKVMETVHVLASCTPMSGSTPDRLTRQFVACLDSSGSHCCSTAELGYGVVAR